MGAVYSSEMLAASTRLHSVTIEKTIIPNRVLFAS
jgi:hypothetical protein